MFFRYLTFVVIMSILYSCASRPKYRKTASVEEITVPHSVVHNLNISTMDEKEALSRDDALTQDLSNYLLNGQMTDALSKYIQQKKNENRELSTDQVIHSLMIEVQK